MKKKKKIKKREMRVAKVRSSQLKKEMLIRKRETNLKEAIKRVGPEPFI